MPVVDDFVDPQVVNLVVESEVLFASVLELVSCMGMVINPRFYLSLDDFTLEYAEDTLAELGELFWPLEATPGAVPNPICNRM